MVDVIDVFIILACDLAVPLDVPLRQSALPGDVAVAMMAATVDDAPVVALGSRFWVTLTASRARPVSARIGLVVMLGVIASRALAIAIRIARSM